MATLQVNGDYFIRMPKMTFDLMAYRGMNSGTSVLPTEYYVWVGDWGLLFNGTGIKVDRNQFPIAGHVTRFVVFDEYAVENAIEINGIGLDLKAITDAGLSKTFADDREIIKLMFSGDDTLKGGRFQDELLGYAGDDILAGNAGGDLLVGGGGSDTASYEAALKGVIASLADSTRNTNDAKGDIYSSIENLAGSSHADRLYGDGLGNELSGGAGDDILSAGLGDDQIYGGRGGDNLVGGAGADQFIYKRIAKSTVALAGRDTLFDFSGKSGDKIDLHVIDANVHRDGNQSFLFVGSGSFTGKSGELRYNKTASDTYIYADVDGDKKADFSIHLDDAVTLSKGYFVL